MSGLNIISILESLNNIGLWDIVTALAAVNLSFFFFFLRRRRLPKFSINFTYYTGVDSDFYPNVICIEARNLLDTPVVVSNPNFRMNSVKAGDAAHGNSATGDYEIKFRAIDSKGNVDPGSPSRNKFLLRHRDSYFSYMPIDNELSEEEIKRILDRNTLIDRIFSNNVLGTLTLDVVVLNEGKPSVVRMSLPVKNIRRHPCSPPIGRGAHPGHSAQKSTVPK